jgi:membrane protease YdiL (CAAX protease family)
VSSSSHVAAAVGIFVAYVVVVAVVWRANHVHYDALAESRATVVRGIVVPIGLGALLLAAATTWLGWWTPVMVQDPRSGAAWTWVVPALIAAVALVGVSGIDWRAPQRDLLPWLAVGVLLVGFAEELLCRGLLVVAPQQAGWSPWGVWLLSSGLFALLHGLNGFFGQSWQATALQMVMSFLIGTGFYVTRMTTGLLVVGMLLHALWDFGTLGTAGTKGTPRPVGGIGTLVTAAVSLVAAWAVNVG